MYDIIFNPTSVAKNANESEKQRKIYNTIDKSLVPSEHMPLSQSIAFAPYPSKELVLGYADRSTYLFKNNLHSECVQDIDRALALDCPEDLRAKLYVRKIECLMILGDCSTDSILKEAQYWLNKMSLNDTREELQAKLDTLHQKTSRTESDVQGTFKQAQTKKPSNELPLPIIASPSNEVPCASDAVIIKYDERYGRHIVATRDITPGEVIAVEKPYASIPLQNSAHSHCSNCLKGGWANIPCTNCPAVMYCSEECRDIDWKRCHDVECAVFHLINYKYSQNTEQLLSIRLAILAVREANNIQEFKAMLKEVDKHDDPRTRGFSKDGKLHSDKYIGIYSLMTHADKRWTEEIFKMSFFASFISYLVATRTEMFGTTLSKDVRELANNENVTFFGSIIMRHFQTTTCDRQYICRARDRIQKAHDLNATSFHSLMNHSCDPNVFRFLHRSNHVVTYAMYPIKKDEQLFDCYGPHYSTMQVDYRKEILRRQCYFNCDCIPCKKDWPTWLYLPSFRTLVKEDTNKAKIIEALSKLITYRPLIGKGNVQDNLNIIKDVLKMVQILYDHVPMPCFEMYNANSVLQYAYDWYANRFFVPHMMAYIG